MLLRTASAANRAACLARHNAVTFASAGRVLGAAPRRTIFWGRNSGGKGGGAGDDGKDDKEKEQASDNGQVNFYCHRELQPVPNLPSLKAASAIETAPPLCNVLNLCIRSKLLMFAYSPPLRL